MQIFCFHSNVEFTFPRDNNLYGNFFETEIYQGMFDTIINFTQRKFHAIVIK